MEINTKTKILIVEDEKLVGMDIRENLTEMGYIVTAIVDSGEEAFKSIKTDKPDIVIMDIMINGELDGIETADIIRKEYGIPIIFTSANNDHYTLLKAKKVQPYSFLVKPVRTRELYIAIEIAVYKYKMEVDLQQSKEWFEMTLKSISDGIIAVNHKGVLTFMNQSAEILTGWTREEALGRDLIDILKFKDFTNNYDHSLVNEFGDIKFLNTHSLINNKTGEVINIQTNDSIIKDKEGNHIGMVIVMRRVSLEEQLGVGSLTLLKA